MNIDSKQEYAVLNNEFVNYKDAMLHVSDLAFQRGFGIFDFFKVVNGEPVFLEEHLIRFMHSAKGMGLPVRHSIEELKSLMLSLLDKNQMPNSGVKIILTGGYSQDAFSLAEPNFVVTQSSFTINQDAQEKGIKVISVKHQRQLSDIKTIDYLMAIKLLPQMKEQGAGDILYYNNEWITECPRANFFIVTKSGEILTPRKDILSGISRQKILELSGKEFTIRACDISLQDVYQAEEAFISSTTKNILPIVAIDEYSFGDGTPGAITRSLSQKYDEVIEKAYSK